MFTKKPTAEEIKRQREIAEQQKAKTDFKSGLCTGAGSAVATVIVTVMANAIIGAGKSIAGAIRDYHNAKKANNENNGGEQNA